MIPGIEVPAKNTRRPATLKLLCAAVLVFSIINTLRFVSAISNWIILQQVGPDVLPLYQAVKGLTWAVVGISSLIGLWNGKLWAYWLTLLGTLLFTTWYWLDRIFLAGSDAANNNWLFVAVLTSLVMVIFLSLIFLVREDVFKGKGTL
jgi:hypothetical protein